MKHINFIKPLSTQERFSIKIWYLSSLFFGVSTIAGLAMLSIHRYFLLKNLEQEVGQISAKISSFNTLMDTKQELKKKEKKLKDQLDLVNKNHQSLKEYVTLVHQIKKSLKKHAQLESLTIDLRSISLLIDCTQTQQATAAINALKNVPDIDEIRLSSLHPQQQGNSTSLRLNLLANIKQKS